LDIRPDTSVGINAAGRRPTFGRYGKKAVRFPDESGIDELWPFVNGWSTWNGDSVYRKSSGQRFERLAVPRSDRAEVTVVDVMTVEASSRSARAITEASDDTVNGHRFLPVAAIGSPHWRPCFLGLLATWG
jgi:hypothetical protein